MSALSALLVLCLALLADGYRILAVFPSQDRNNFQTYQGLVRELANRNHEVTLISHFSLPDAPAAFKEVLLSETPVHKGLAFDSVITNEISRVPFETLVLTKSGNDDCRTLMNNHQVIHMLRTRPKFDVILVESYNSDCGLALAANLSAPYIAFSPQPIQPWQFNRAGVTFNSAAVTQSGLHYGREPWFLDRLKSFVLYYVANWVYYVGSQVTDRVYLYKYLGDDLPTLESVASNASVVLVNTHQSVFGGVPRADNVVDVGGIHVRSPNALPVDIDKFISDAEHGVLYVNLGSTVKDSTLPKDKLNELLKTFSKIPFRVLWKWDGESIDNLPRNVLTRKWLPQYDIIRHSNVKAFVSHAGILSTIEAIDVGIPVIAVPLFGDQYGNAATLRDAGIGTIVDYDNLKMKYLLDALNEVLDPKVQQRAMLVSRLWHDRPSTPLDTAIYWVEYVARYNGAPNLPAFSAQKPCYQQWQIDVLAFVAVTLYVLAYAFCKILSVFCCWCCRNETSESAVDERRKRVKFE